jgi:hypothetical protein
MEIEPHKHIVRLNLFHSEVSVDYGLRSGTQLTFRLPYDQKSVDVRYTTLDGAPFLPPYGDIHHRDETLRGFSDADVMAFFAPSALQLGRSRWTVGMGLTIPLGETTEDPVRLGREGKTHEHIQFGSGTFTPRFVLRYRAPFDRTIVQGSLNLQLPLYENGDGFLAPRSLQANFGPTWRLGRLALATEAAAQLQTQGKWSGEVDEGTGFRNAGLTFRLGIPLTNDWHLSPGVYRELYSHGTHHETFEQGTTWSLSLTRLLR